MLAYYVEWHMGQRLAPLLFDDHDNAAAPSQRASIVKATNRRNPLTQQTDEQMQVHSFQSLVADLATLTLNQVQPANLAVPAFHKLANPTPLQQRALDLLGIRIGPPAT
jgi:hypothetical protein